jgi:hypothetical protein
MLRSLAASVARECVRAKEVFLDVLDRALHGDRTDREERDRLAVRFQSDHMIDDARSYFGRNHIRSISKDGIVSSDPLPLANAVKTGTPNSSGIRGLSQGHWVNGILCETWNALRNELDKASSARGVELSGPPPLCTQSPSAPLPTHSHEKHNTQ